MAENPLLPHAELRAMLALTKRCLALDAAACRRAKRSSKAKAPLAGPRSREALVAATTLQLKPGDLLIGERGDETLTALSPASEGSPSNRVALLPDTGRQFPRLLLATAMASALHGTGTERLVLATLRERAIEPEWPVALAWAQERQLPLVLVCADSRGYGAFRPDPRAPKQAFTWSTVRQTASRLKLPILTVDGEDAVAVYRAMQESVLRARAGGGPALLWAMLPSHRDPAVRPRSAQPLRRLEQYLLTRNVPF